MQLVLTVEATGTTPAVATGRVLVTPQISSGVAIFPAFPSLSGMFSSASQGRSVVKTSITHSGSNHQVSHPIVIQPSRPGPSTCVVMGVEGLTLPLDPAVTITATVARLVDPVGSQTSLQGLASHQASIAKLQGSMSTSTTIIGTIYGPGLPGPITVAGGSTEPGIRSSWW